VRRQFIGRADHRVEARELMAAVEIGAELILEPDLRQVEAPARGQRKPCGEIDRVSGVEAIIGVASLEIDRRDWSPEDDAGPGDEQVAANGAELTCRIEPHIAVIEARPNHELIVAPEQLVTVGGLHRATDRLRDRPGAIERTRNGTTQNIGDLDTILVEKWSRGVSKAQPWARDAGLGVADIAVDVLLPEAADIGVALDRPGVAQPVAAGRIEERKLVPVDLRRGV